MLHIKNLLSGAACLFSISAMVSCASQEDCPELPKAEDPNQPHTCELILNVTKNGYDDASQTRSASDWENGDKIYLTFTIEDGVSYGDAIYKDGTWTVNYYGTLTANAQTKCTAVYFDNPDFESSSVVNLSANTGIYEDLNGSYLFSDGTLAVTADLKPKTGRIRFTGTDKEEITLYGITHYSSYDCSNGKYTTSVGAIKTAVSSDTTPYVYGYFSDETLPRLNVITANSGFTRILSTSIYKPGESGYMSIPTQDSHNGWQNSVIFKVNGVEFTMIPVTYEDGNFLLAETETTEELYDAILGNGTSNSKQPASGYSWDSFLSKLKAMTELDFRLPTLAEWQFAFKGGNKSQSYTYSGSNIISNVAWYSGNSNGVKHEVKQLQPNELGFYDMSGNVAECISDVTSRYYGGYYRSSESACIINAFINLYDYAGLRIALTNK